MLNQGGIVLNPADIATGRPGDSTIGLLLGHSGFDRILKIVAYFGATAGEELDAVVRHGVVAGRDHDAEISRCGTGQEGNTGCGQDPEAYDIDAGTGQAGHHSCFQKFTGGTRIPSNQCPWTAI